MWAKVLLDLKLPTCTTLHWTSYLQTSLRYHLSQVADHIFMDVSQALFDQVESCSAAFFMFSSKSFHQVAFDSAKARINKQLLNAPPQGRYLVGICFNIAKISKNKKPLFYKPLEKLKICQKRHIWQTAFASSKEETNQIKSLAPVLSSNPSSSYL